LDVLGALRFPGLAAPAAIRRIVTVTRIATERPLSEPAEITAVTSPADIDTVCRLAREIWTEHYTPIIGPAQVQYMLDQYQSPSAVAEQIADGYRYDLIRCEGQPAGYAAVQGDAASCATFLSKIYVHPQSQGQGLGRALLRHIEARSRTLDHRTIWLTVNKHNHRAIAWYAHVGFVQTGPVVTDIGHGFVMDDYRFEKRLF
jgi:ribosomal protein S18 acetylase RimI-like enzyme